MKLTIVFVFAFCFCSSAEAQSSRYRYDAETGNSYSTRRSYNGDTEVRGNNLRSGTTWNTTVEKDGDMRGQDSQGNSWRYDSRSSVYNNFGTGETCVGKGRTRTCN